MANLNQFCDFTKLIGIDIAKRVFQIYSCDTQTGEITNVQVKRDKVLESFANCGKPEFADLIYAYRVLDSGRLVGQSSHLVGLRSNQASLYLGA